MLAAAALISGILTTSTALAAEAPEAAAPLTGDAICTKCHDKNEEKPVLSIYATRHGVKADARTPSCQSCHGDSDAHVKNVEGLETRPAPDVLFGMRSGPNSSFGRSDAEVQNQPCMTCHQDALGKRTYWAGSQHQRRKLACVSCHEVHAKQDKVLAKNTQPEVCYACHKEQRAQANRPSHHPIREGKVVCSNCHNPHGSTGPKLLIKNTVTETCYTCHAEKRGPFLWEHPPASANCLNCHTPHGSNNPTLLKTRMPYLCQQCHDATFHPSTVYSGRGIAGGPAPAQQMLLRSCANCHTQVHGSNHPSGPRLTR